MKKVELGTKVRDMVTGFVGVVTGRTEWLTGCATVGLQGEVKDGKVPDAFWVDETRVEGFDDAAAVAGGPHDAPHNPSLRGE